MKSQFTDYKLSRLLRTASKRFEAEILQNCQQHCVDLSKDQGSGRLSVYDFEDGVQALLLDGTFPEDWKITTHSKAESPFLMYLNIRGDIDFNYDGLAQPIKIQPLKTVAVAHPAAVTQTISFKHGQHITLLWLLLERSLYIHHIRCLPEPVQREVMTIFGGKTAIKIFQNSAFGLKGAAIVQKILDDDKKGLIHSTYVEAKSLELLSLQLRCWEEEISGAPVGRLNLRPEDSEKIIAARSLLIEDLQNAPTIEELAKKSGVNRQKLKKGFKLVFGKTINEYLRAERLKLARQLLSTGNPVVREVAALVGYENAGYFARRFKEAYGVYPKEFMSAMAEQFAVPAES